RSLTVRSPSSVTVRGAVITPRKLAVALGLSGSPPPQPPFQLLATPQLPLALTPHWGGGPRQSPRRSTMSLFSSTATVATIPENPLGFEMEKKLAAFGTGVRLFWSMMT